MDRYAVYLKPRGSLASPIGSDTIFGAVCWALETLKLVKVGELLANFSPPKYAFSSLFPACRVEHNSNVEIVRFFPRPLMSGLAPAQIEELSAELRETSAFKERPKPAATVKVVENEKRWLKKATWMSESLFTEIVEQGLTTFDLYRRIDAAPSKIQIVGGMLTGEADYRRMRRALDVDKGFIQSEAVQHNQIDRVLGASAEGLLFFEQETFFRGGAGLWCLAQTQDEEAKRWLEAAFRYLSDTGLGANRTTGKGHFEITLGELTKLPDAGENANAMVTLSCYLPKEGEWRADRQPLRYTLEMVWAKREAKFPRVIEGGRSAPIYKEPVRMFTPGSVFPLNQRAEVYGRLAQVVKAKDNGGVAVWQSGLAVPVFAKA